MVILRGLNPLFDKNFLALSKSKVFADKNNNNVQFLTDRIENIVVKGENAGFQHFLLLPQCFQKASSLGLFKVRIVCERVNHYFAKIKLMLTT